MELSDGIAPGGETVITDITLKKDDNTEQVFFTICGKEFSESFDVRYGGVSGGEGVWLCFRVPCGEFRICKKQQVKKFVAQKMAARTEIVKR